VRQRCGKCGRRRKTAHELDRARWCRQSGWRLRRFTERMLRLTDPQNAGVSAASAVPSTIPKT